MAQFFKLIKKFINYALGLFSNDMGIDLGTATTLVYVKGQGIVLCEPSVVAIQKGTHNVLAVGEEAKRMLGRTPGNIVAIRPMKDGVIADFEITEDMLRYFIKKVHNRKVFVRPRMVIAIPSGITEVEKRAVKDSAEHAGAREVYLVEEPISAAIGVGLPIQEPSGNMIIDIGGGTTEIAVISLAGIVFSRSIRIGGDELDEAGLPKTITVSSEEIREAIAGPISAVLEATRMTLERTPPELSADLIERGIIIAGGGALLRGFDKLISEETGLPVHVAEDPMTAVAIGTGKVLSEIKYLKKVTVRSKLDF